MTSMETSVVTANRITKSISNKTDTEKRTIALNVEGMSNQFN